MAKRQPKITLNLLQGKKVMISTDQLMVMQNEVGEMEQIPMVYQGLFIYSDEHDVYLNTVDLDPNVFNTVINRSMYTQIEVIVDEPAIITMDSKAIN